MTSSDEDEETSSPPETSSGADGASSCRPETYSRADEGVCCRSDMTIASSAVGLITSLFVSSLELDPGGAINIELFFVTVLRAFGTTFSRSVFNPAE